MIRLFRVAGMITFANPRSIKYLWKYGTADELDEFLFKVCRLEVETNI
jgi:hypothetical protein